MPEIPSSALSLRERAQQLKQQAAARNQSQAAGAADEQNDAERSSDLPVGGGDYVVAEGECVSSIATKTGYYWETIWNDPANSEVKTARKDPNQLLPGDRLTLPQKTPKYETGATELRHRFVRRGEPSSLVIRILDDDEPVANAPYELKVGNHLYEGVTTGDGVVEVVIPGDATTGLLTVYPAGKDDDDDEPEILEYHLELGEVSPVETNAGVQARLNNLGIACDVTGTEDEQTIDAVNTYRAQKELAPEERISDETRQLLKKDHDE